MRDFQKRAYDAGVAQCFVDHGLTKTAEGLDRSNAAALREYMDNHGGRPLGAGVGGAAMGVLAGKSIAKRFPGEFIPGVDNRILGSVAGGLLGGGLGTAAGYASRSSQEDEMRQMLLARQTAQSDQEAQQRKLIQAVLKEQGGR